MTLPIYDFSSKKDLENFNHVIALNLDDMKSFIDEVTNNLNVDIIDKNYFGILASLLSVDLTNTEDEYLQRRQLKTALDTIRSKGTLECFRVLMYNFGLEIDVIPLWTPDYYEEVKVSAPYIKITMLPEVSEGTYDVTVLNPDNQFNSFSSFVME